VRAPERAIMVGRRGACQYDRSSLTCRCTRGTNPRRSARKVKTRSAPKVRVAVSALHGMPLTADNLPRL
jgi:hypothetical protein